jgi:hypothetical protein
MRIGKVNHIEIENVGGDLVVWMNWAGETPVWKAEGRTPYVLGDGKGRISWASVQRAVRAKAKLEGRNHDT